MRRRGKLRTGLLILLTSMAGCATTQTVRWRENPTDAATRVAELSASRTATIDMVNGGRIWARNISFVSDSVRWAGSRDGALHKMALAEVASIEIVVGRHTLEGAWKGALIGGGTLATYLGIACIAERRGDGTCGVISPADAFAIGAFLGGVVGTVVGGLFGASNADKVIFVPQE